MGISNQRVGSNTFQAGLRVEVRVRLRVGPLFLESFFPKNVDVCHDPSIYHEKKV